MKSLVVCSVEVLAALPYVLDLPLPLLSFGADGVVCCLSEGGGWVVRDGDFAFEFGGH